MNPNEIIEVIAKSKCSVYKITNITYAEYLKMKRKPTFTYIPYQKGASHFKNAKTINYKTNKS